MPVGIRHYVEIDGADRLAEALRQIPKRVAKTALRKAVNAGGTVIAKAYRKNLPKKSTGLLRKSVKKKVKKSKKGEAYFAVVGGDFNITGTRNGRFYRPAMITHFWETGVKPHTVGTLRKIGRSKGLKMEGLTSAPGLIRQTAKLPGFQPSSPLERAVRSTAGTVRAAMDAKMAEAIEEAAARHRGG